MMAKMIGFLKTNEKQPYHETVVFAIKILSNPGAAVVTHETQHTGEIGANKIALSFHSKKCDACEEGSFMLENSLLRI